MGLALKGETLHGALERLTLVTRMYHLLMPRAGPAYGAVLVRGKGLGVLTKGSQAGVCPGVKTQV